MIEPLSPPRLRVVSDETCGLTAVLALDTEVPGPGVGGIRTYAYPDFEAGALDARRLARAMSLKCAIAGLKAAGAKTVVFDHPDLDRPRAFARLGTFIHSLGGGYRAAGDLGTTSADLRAAAAHTSHVHTDEPHLAHAAGVGLANCLIGVARRRGVDPATLRIAVQGCGAIGAAAARGFAALGAEIVVADIDQARAEALARSIGATVVSASAVLTADVDVIAPCAAGGVLTTEVVANVRAWCICGGANNQLESVDAEALLDRRGIVYVPDFVASAGAVIEGMAATVGTADAASLLGRLTDTVDEILAGAEQAGVTTRHAAERIALQRISARRRALAFEPPPGC